MSPVKVGVGQITVIPGEIELNLETAGNAIETLASQGARVVVLPETLDLGWCYPDSAKLARPDRVLEFFGTEARRAGINVVFGFTDLREGRPYNASAFVSPEGEILGRHAKVNELDFGRDVYGVGASTEVFESEVGRVAIPICADAFADEPIEDAVAAGAEFLFSPCAWAVPPDFEGEYGGHWIEAYSKATSRGVAVLGVSNVGRVVGGPWHDHPVIGASLAVSSKGEVIRQGRFGEAELFVIELS